MGFAVALVLYGGLVLYWGLAMISVRREPARQRAGRGAAGLSR